MKSLMTLMLALIVTIITNAQPPEGPANAGMTFGEKVTAKGAIDINELASTITEEPTTVKIKGVVSEVCTKEGCWLKMKTANGSMMVKMKDHAFLVPLSMNGKEIVVEGKAKMKVTSVKELQHFAEDAGKSEMEIAEIKDPKKEILINAVGILVL